MRPIQVIARASWKEIKTQGASKLFGAMGARVREGIKHTSEKRGGEGLYEMWNRGEMVPQYVDQYCDRDGVCWLYVMVVNPKWTR